MKDEIRDNPDTKDSFSEKNQNLFFIIASAVLILSAAYLSYSILDYAGVFTSGKKSELKPQNVQQLVQVEVLNGCGVAGIGDKFTDIIRSKGFDVVRTGNYMSFEIDNTFIIDRAGKTETAYRVADSLGIDKMFVISEINKSYFLDLTIVIGKDYTNYF